MKLEIFLAAFSTVTRSAFTALKHATQNLWRFHYRCTCSHVICDCVEQLILAFCEVFSLRLQVFVIVIFRARYKYLKLIQIHSLTHLREPYQFKVSLTTSNLILPR
jgi:hypothetical protein